MNKYIIILVLLALIILSYTLGILAFSSREAREEKWQEYYKKYEDKLKKKDV